MLHPNQFIVNEAWIIFRINEAPIQTGVDGCFNCLALMDAASCFILGSEFIPATEKEPTELEVRRLLKQGENHKQQLPKAIFLQHEQACASITRVAGNQGITVEQVSERDLLIFIGEARDGFQERFGKGKA